MTPEPGGPGGCGDHGEPLLGAGHPGVPRFFAFTRKGVADVTHPRYVGNRQAPAPAQNRIRSDSRCSGNTLLWERERPDARPRAIAGRRSHLAGSAPKALVVEAGAGPSGGGRFIRFSRSRGEGWGLVGGFGGRGGLGGRVPGVVRPHRGMRTCPRWRLGAGRPTPAPARNLATGPDPSKAPHRKPAPAPGPMNASASPSVPWSRQIRR